MTMWKLNKIGSDQQVHVYVAKVPDAIQTDEQRTEVDGMARIITAGKAVVIDGIVLKPVSFSSSYDGLTGLWTYFASFRHVADFEMPAAPPAPVPQLQLVAA